MPATLPAAFDSSLITITPSAPFELLMAVGSVHLRPYRHRGWVDRARETLGPELLREIEYFTGHHCQWLALTEFPVDYGGDPLDVDAFIDYVEQLPPDDFLFYLWGRVIPRAEIPAARQDPRLAMDRLTQFYSWVAHEKVERMKNIEEVFCDAVLNLERTQARAVRLLRTFHERIFRQELPGLKQRWAASIAEQRALLERMDPDTFLSRLTNNRQLPKMFPEGTPLQRVQVVPCWFIWKSGLDIWGYGTVYRIYDAGLTESRRNEIDHDVTRLTRLASALSDPTRLRILRSIAQEDDVYGHRLSRLHGISQPAVSRHMGILKDAGLVSEEPRDGKIIYRLNREPVDSLSPSLLHFFDD